MAVTWQKVAVPRALLRRLKQSNPKLFEHGYNWAVSAILCDQMGMRRLRTPLEAQSAGGRNRKGRGHLQQKEQKTNGSKETN